MFPRMRILLLMLLFASLATADNKKKDVLPAYVLKARTVIVLIDPDSSIPATSPLANRTAQEDVEKALMKWGRLTPTINAQTADLVITVRRGNTKSVQPTMGRMPTNDRPVIFQPSDTSIRIGGQQGRPPNAPNAPPDTSEDPGPRPGPGVEVGSSEDSFVVYEGHVDRPTERPAVWRYMAKDGLRSPSVPAVSEFRKLIEQSEKQQKTKP
jgi:hypothetical protein